LSDYDAVVAGGGPAGATAALVLAAAGRRVLLAGGGVAAVPVGEALPGAARPLLRDLGLLARVEAGGHLPCVGNVSAWGGPEPAVRDFVREPHGAGWHLDRARYDDDLRRAARDAGAVVDAAARVAAVEPERGGWRVRLDFRGSARHGRRDRPEAPSGRHGQAPDGRRGGSDVRAAWLIDATGRAAAVARRLGARRHRDDRLVAFVARGRQEPGAAPDRDDRTWVEAVPGGWWYSARVPAGERVFVFHTDPLRTAAARAERAALLDAAAFAARLRGAPRLGALVAAHGYRLAGRPRGVDASSARLDPAAGGGWLAVGDAAASFDPLSSQGLLNAHYTGLHGAGAVLGALDGDAAAVAAYAARIGEIHRAYLAHRAAAYAAERRWPAAPFWAARAA
jgi:flavin-dependent dehydrogenase